MIILFMIVSVAIFNIISTLVMIVNEKNRNCFTKSFGASKGFIVSIFVLLGTIIGFIGTFVGVILGLTVALNLSEIVLFIESLLVAISLPVRCIF